MATRRDIIIGGAAATILTASARGAVAGYAPVPADWRRFEITTRVTLPRGGAAAQAWVPVPSIAAAEWIAPGETRWSGNADHVRPDRTGDAGARLIHAIWSKGDGPALLEIVSTVATRDRAVDPRGTAGSAALTPADRARYLAPTALIPTDGIVRATAETIVAGARDDREKARRIYDWIVEHAARDPETRGCGLGDVAFMLTTGDLTGKCADLNALFVGLARAAGLPARDLYGLRVAPSAFGYRSLGAGTSDVTRTQHCRAEVFLDGTGWLPVDPADVRKVVLEEGPSVLSLFDRRVEAVRAALFGASEANWIGYNAAHDVTLPGSSRAPLPFLMYPQGEIAGTPRDELAPQDFAYAITARELRD